MGNKKNALDRLKGANASLNQTVDALKGKKAPKKSPAQKGADEKLPKLKGKAKRAAVKKEVQKRKTYESKVIAGWKKGLEGSPSTMKLKEEVETMKILTRIEEAAGMYAAITQVEGGPAAKEALVMACGGGAIEYGPFKSAKMRKFIKYSKRKIYGFYYKGGEWYAYDTNNSDDDMGYSNFATAWKKKKSKLSWRRKKGIKYELTKDVGDAGKSAEHFKGIVNEVDRALGVVERWTSRKFLDGRAGAKIIRHIEANGATSWISLNTKPVEKPAAKGKGKPKAKPKSAAYMNLLTMSALLGKDKAMYYRFRMVDRSKGLMYALRLKNVPAGEKGLPMLYEIKYDNVKKNWKSATWKEVPAGQMDKKLALLTKSMKIDQLRKEGLAHVTDVSKLSDEEILGLTSYARSMVKLPKYSVEKAKNFEKEAAKKYLEALKKRVGQDKAKKLVLSKYKPAQLEKISKRRATLLIGQIDTEISTNKEFEYAKKHKDFKKIEFTVVVHEDKVTLSGHGGKLTKLKKEMTPGSPENIAKFAGAQSKTIMGGLAAWLLGGEENFKKALSGKGSFFSGIVLALTGFGGIAKKDPNAKPSFIERLASGPLKKMGWMKEKVSTKDQLEQQFKDQDGENALAVGVKTTLQMDLEYDIKIPDHIRKALKTKQGGLNLSIDGDPDTTEAGKRYIAYDEGDIIIHKGQKLARGTVIPAGAIKLS